MSWLTPRIPDQPTGYVPWTRRELVVAGIVALLVVSTLGITVVAPAEFGKDPTGAGQALGLLALSSPAPEPLPPEPPVVNQTPLSAFAYQWTTSNVLFFEETGESIEGASTTIPVDVTAANVTRVTAFLTWEDAAAFGDPQPDTFTLKLAGPAGTAATTASNSGTSGTAVANVTAAALPPSGNVTATDAAEARTMIQAQHAPHLAGTGRWDVTVTLDDVADLIGDDGNAWRLQVFVETFSLDLGDERPTPVQEITVTLQLSASGEWKEYKVAMAEGATLTYDWSASGDLQWDFHGRDIQTGKETSHLRGTSDGEAGDLVVPFAGQHGWAWRNRGSSDVELTVTLRGQFAILG